MTDTPSTSRNDDAYKTFLFEYGFGGKRWSMEVCARDPEEAKLRLSTCASFGRLEGELMMKIPAAPAMGWLPRLICWWRNR